MLAHPHRQVQSQYIICVTGDSFRSFIAMNLPLGKPSPSRMLLLVVRNQHRKLEGGPRIAAASLAICALHMTCVRLLCVWCPYVSWSRREGGISWEPTHTFNAAQKAFPDLWSHEKITAERTCFLFGAVSSGLVAFFTLIANSFSDLRSDQSMFQTKPGVSLKLTSGGRECEKPSRRFKMVI